jgi:site-specific recombinase XerD
VDKTPIPIRTHQRNSPRSSLSMKTEERLPQFLTSKEINELLASLNSDKPVKTRDKAILELLYASGIRVSELCRLDLDNIELDERKIRVTGKGSKEREVLIGIPAEKALRNYILEAREKLRTGKSKKALFLNYKGDRLAVGWVQKQLKHYASAIGIEKDVHPHVLRHTFATHMLDGGADLRVVQELLGHADLSSTQIYTHVTKQQARKVYLNSHPMAAEKEEENDTSE